jgi:hypothetical protein
MHTNKQAYIYTHTYIRTHARSHTHIFQELDRRKAKEQDGENDSEKNKSNEEAEAPEKGLGPLFVNAQISLEHGHTSLIDFIAHKIIYYDLRDDFVAKLYYPTPKASRSVVFAYTHAYIHTRACI